MLETVKKILETFFGFEGEAERTSYLQPQAFIGIPAGARHANTTS
jgi:hypothetical protein